jgi:DNA-binding IclR family transcriptional regulator
MARAPARKTAPGGVNSLELGLSVARALASRAQPQALKDVAAAAGMTPAKAHRYLVSLIRAGMAEQEHESSRYRLGPLALELGLAALNGLDVLKFGGEAVSELTATIDETALLAIWGNKGPVVVRWEESTRPIATNVRAGWVMPLTSSATGRLFAAYLPPLATAAMIKAELRGDARALARFGERLAQIRAAGVSLVDGDLLPGVAAVAAPVFGHDGQLAASLAALGLQGSFDIGPKSPVIDAVRQAAMALSRRLGYTAQGQHQGRQR